MINLYYQIKKLIKTRSTAQIRSHAQKYIMKLCKHNNIKTDSKKIFYLINSKCIEHDEISLKIFKLMKEEMDKISQNIENGENSGENVFKLNNNNNNCDIKIKKQSKVISNIERLSNENNNNYNNNYYYNNKGKTITVSTKESKLVNDYNEQSLNEASLLSKQIEDFNQRNLSNCFKSTYNIDSLEKEITNLLEKNKELFESNHNYFENFFQNIVHNLKSILERTKSL